MKYMFTVLAILSVTVLAACAKHHTEVTGGNLQSGGSGGAGGGSSSGTVIDKGPRLTVAPMYGRQLLASYLNVTGVAMNATLSTAFEDAKDQLPQAGLGSEVSTTAVYAVASLASQVCDAFVTKEKAITTASSRVAYGAIDFTRNTAALTDDQFKTTANNLAKLFLSRELTTAELGDASKMKAAALNGAANDTATVQKLSVALCTAVASSVEATEL